MKPTTEDLGAITDELTQLVRRYGEQGTLVSQLQAAVLDGAHGPDATGDRRVAEARLRLQRLEIAMAAKRAEYERAVTEHLASLAASHADGAREQHTTRVMTRDLVRAMRDSNRSLAALWITVLLVGALLLLS